MFYITDENGNPIPIAGTGANPNLDCSKAELLWTNPDPTSTFDGQKIDVALTKYDGYRVLFRFYTTDATTFVQEFVTGVNGVLNALSYNSIFRRNISYSNDGLTFSTMDGYKVSDATRIQNNDYLIPYKIYGILKTPAMIYTGEELFEGANVNINNGMISVRQLVADITFGSASSFEITDLDLQGDGGVYDIIIEPPLTSAQSNFRFRLNNNSSTAGYVHSFFDIDPQNKALTIGSQSTSDGWAYLGAYGPNPNSIFMTLMSSQGRAIWTIDTVGYLGRLDFEKFFGYTVTANVTSMQILANSTLSAGLKVKIYRRLS